MAPETNRLIAALSPEAGKQLLSSCKAVELPARTELYVPERPITYAYFLTSGIASTVVTVADGGSAEVALSGTEGAVGSLAVIGPLLPSSSCLMQLNGAGLRISIADLRRCFDESLEIRTLLLENIQAQAIVLNQIAGCNRLHQAPERLARWLLTAADLSFSSNIPLTQDSIAQMLGTRRTTIALVAGELQRSGMISYRRGKVEILDREMLTEAACSCYGITRDLMGALYGGAAGGVSGGKKRRA